MTASVDTHPEMDTLVAFALGEQGEGADVGDHCRACTDCTQYVGQIQQIQQQVRTAQEYAIPADIERRILAHKKQSKRKVGLCGNWWRNPFVLTLGCAFFALFCYIFLTFVL